MLDRMGPETWVSDRGCFMFRHETTGGRWTFIVERSTLETLAGESEPDLDEIFDYYREAIYQAARERAAASAPARQHRIKVQDIAGFRDTLIF